ncbi:ribonuclease H-like protein [Pilatotrama ljubarskyi]|nr:ribonuclease H-like protein [Pilatotrama ljubarskyi]
MGKSGKGGFYAVARGRVPGVYASWDECQAQTAGFAGNKHQKFSSLEQARQYLAANGVPTGSVPASSSSSAPAASQPVPLSSASSSTHPSIARAAQAGSTSGRRTHGTKPYARVQPPASKTSARADVGSGRNSQWASLSAEVIEDETGWDVVYSDGSCRGNGKVGSVAGIGVWWGENDARRLHIRNGLSSSRPTPNTASAVRPSPPSTHAPSSSPPAQPTVSAGFRHWMPKWLRNNFKTASGEPVKNAPLIRYLSALLDERARHGQKVHLQYIKGHAGHVGNEGADRLANMGATMPQEPERDWEALMDAKVRISSPCRLIRRPDLSGTMRHALIQAYAAGLADDAELLEELEV